MNDLRCPDCGRFMRPYKTKVNHWRCMTKKCRAKVEQLVLFDVKKATKSHAKKRGAKHE